MENPSANHSGCHEVGIVGGCGDDCYVYLNGECPIADELYDDIKDGKGSLELYLELYEHLLKDIDLCIHEEGITPIDGWIICKKCGTDLKRI